MDGNVFTLPLRPEFLAFPARGIALRVDAIESVEPGRPAKGLVTVQLKRPITTYESFGQTVEGTPEPPYPVKNGAVVLVLRDREAAAVTALFFGGLPWAYSGYNGVVLDVGVWGAAVEQALKAKNAPEASETQAEPELVPGPAGVPVTFNPSSRPGMPRLKI